MPYELVKETQGRYLRVLFQGKVTLEVMQNVRQHAMAELAALHWARLLVDLREAKPPPMNMDHYALYHRPSLLPQGAVRVALLGDFKDSDAWQYAENAAKLSGVTLRVFFSEADALGWLGRDEKEASRGCSVQAIKTGDRP